jgi:hypothetical protein
MPALLICLSILQLVLLLRRVLSDYSGVLYWDEWDARLTMDVPFGELNWNLLWQQHNEHRIVLSKILFFLDFRFFNGSNIPLIFLNFVFVAMTVLVMHKTVGLGADRAPKNSRIALIYIFTLFSFSVLQIENYSWGFQTQFFLSVLIPLTSFLFYLKFTTKNQNRYLVLSYFCALASLGTMASGNFSIIVILLTSLYLRRQVREVATHALVAFFLLSLYTYEYESSNASPLATFIQHPEFVANYVLTYFTSPINQLTYFKIPTIISIFTLGVFLSSLRRVFLNMKYRDISILNSIGIMIFLYTFLIALVSAGGRYYFGVGQASASRYTTISLLGWFGAILVLANKNVKSKEVQKFTWVKLAIVLTFAFLPFQIINSNAMNDVKSHRNLASIALLHSIQDDSISIALYPSGQRVAELSNSLIENKKSIFTWGFQETHNPKGLSLSNSIDRPNCIGFVDSIRISSSGKGFIVVGWVAAEAGDDAHLNLLATNEMGNVVGAGISGFTRDDVAQQLGPWSGKAGFQLVSRIAPDRIFAVDNGEIRCQLKFKKINE